MTNNLFSRLLDQYVQAEAIPENADYKCVVRLEDSGDYFCYAIGGIPLAFHRQSLIISSGNTDTDDLYFCPKRYADKTRLFLCFSENTVMHLYRLNKQALCFIEPQHTARSLKKHYREFQEFREIVVVVEPKLAWMEQVLASIRAIIPKWKYAQFVLSDSSNLAFIEHCIERPPVPTVLSVSELSESEVWEAQPKGLPTGFADLDEVWGGMRAGELTVVTGDTACGKTTFGVNLIFNLVQGGTKCYMASCEMRLSVLMQKLASLTLQKPARVLGALTAEDKKNFAAWRKHASLWVNKHGDTLSLPEVSKIVEYGKCCLGIEVFFLEDLGHLAAQQNNYDSSHKFVEEIMSSLHVLCLQHAVHIVLIVHPKQSKDDTGKISMADLKGSSGIKQHADNVLGVMRCNRDPACLPEDKNKTIIRVMKNRRMGTEGDVLLQFNGRKEGFDPDGP